MMERELAVTRKNGYSSSISCENRVKVTFIMEQHIGHQAYYQNLHRFIDPAQEIDSAWVEVTYQDKSSPLQRLPFLPGAIKGTLMGRAQVRAGLRAPADLFFFNTQVPAVLGGIRELRKPYIIATDITPLQYDRMGEWYGHSPDGSNLISAYKHSVNARTFQNATCLLPWSSWTGSSLVKDYHVDPNKIEVLPPGVDLELWRPGQQKKAGPLRILFVGGDFLRKGGDLLLQAFQILAQHMAPNWLEMAMATRSKVPGVPNVQLYSHLQPNSAELVRLYQSSDVFVLPSRAEAFGIAAVEACAAGLPIIATSVGGLVDIVEDGRTGFLVEPGEVQPLVEKLSLLLEDRSLRTSMGQAGRNRAELFFNARHNAARVIQLISETVRKG